MYFVKTPWYLQSIYPGLRWKGQNTDTIYLSFDDGPVPSVTTEVLRILSDYQAKATFFVVGSNAVKYPDIYDEVQKQGHIIGNHTMHHLNGWKTGNSRYYRDVAECNEHIHSKLFRPPYGRLGFSQIRELKKHYTICMWDVLSGDFDTGTDATQCTNNVIRHAEGGSIIVFHDSEKAKERVLKSLPPVLDYFAKKNYIFAALD